MKLVIKELDFSLCLPKLYVLLAFNLFLFLFRTINKYYIYKKNKKDKHPSIFQFMLFRFQVSKHVMMREKAN